ncbi:MAG: hypothetical protein M1825_000076 [Sarcosagium campestre]|nr:MAG: hypothetical protein M1825_000076 [Sarcosagium campestre]
MSIKALIPLLLYISWAVNGLEGTSPNGATPKIAVIGAGSGGASAAFYARKYASESGSKVNITVFERSSYVGGRSTTVNVFSDPLEPVELGASIFVSVNRNLVTAARELGLRTQGAHGKSRSSSKGDSNRDAVGVWDGHNFVFIFDTARSSYWNAAKLIWKYGLAPLWTQRLMKSTVGRFLKMYDAPHFPFESLSDVAETLELSSAAGNTGEQFLELNGINGAFAADIVQASTRVNYAQNLGLIHGLETMVCMATDGPMSIEGGNWHIFDGMLTRAGADVRLNTSVSGIESVKGNGKHGRFLIHSHPAESSTSQQSEHFDAVVLAAPLQFSNITISPAPAHPPDVIPYVSLHVTLFTSPRRLSPAFFDLPADSAVPTVVLTTLSASDAPGSSQNGVGTAGFFSISTLRTVLNPHGGGGADSGIPRTEYLYKVFSPYPLNASFVSTILGAPHPDNLDSIVEGGMETLNDNDIVSWSYHKQWHSYPYLYPRVTFEHLELAPALWYTSGIESFISTMETSSLMGMNIARLLVSNLLGRNEGEGQDQQKQATSSINPESGLELGVNHEGGEDKGSGETVAEL